MGGCFVRSWLSAMISAEFSEPDTQPVSEMVETSGRLRKYSCEGFPFRRTENPNPNPSPRTEPVERGEARGL